MQYCKSSSLIYVSRWPLTFCWTRVPVQRWAARRSRSCRPSITSWDKGADLSRADFQSSSWTTFINLLFLFLSGLMRVMSSPDIKSRSSFRRFRTSRSVFLTTWLFNVSVQVVFLTFARVYVPIAQRTSSRWVDERKEGAWKKDERAADCHGGGKKGERTKGNWYLRTSSSWCDLLSAKW